MRYIVEILRKSFIPDHDIGTSTRKHFPQHFLKILQNLEFTNQTMISVNQPQESINISFLFIFLAENSFHNRHPQVNVTHKILILP